MPELANENATAFRTGARNTNIDCLRASCLQLRFCLLNLQIGSKSSRKPVLNQFQLPVHTGNRRVQKLLLASSVRPRSSPKPVAHASIGSPCQIGCTQLRLRSIRLDRAAAPRPQISTW